MIRTLTLIALLGLAPFAFGQSGGAADKARATFARGELALESEGDVERAARLFTRAAELGHGDPAFATRAWLRSAMAWRSVGRMEAVRTSLEHAARGTGPDAETAKRALEGARPQEAVSQEARVEAALLALKQGNKAARLRANTTILRIGRAAAPTIRRALRVDNADLEFVSRVSGGFARLGGPEVVAYLKELRASDDGLLKEAVLEGMMGLKDFLGDGVPEALKAFLDDSAAPVRQRAFKILARTLDIDTLIRGMKDADSGVRRNAISALQRRIASFDRNQDALAERILTAAFSLIDSDSSEAKSAASAFMDWQLLRFPSALNLYLRRLADPATDVMRLGIRSQSSGVIPHRSPIARMPWKEFLAAARAIPATDGPRQMTVSMGIALGSPAAIVSSLSQALMPLWTVEDVPQVLELVRIGHGDPNVQRFLDKTIQKRHHSALIRSIRGFPEPQWVTERVLSAGADEATAAAAREVIRDLAPDIDSPKKVNEWRIEALMKIGCEGADDAAIDELVGLAFEHTALMPSLLTALIWREDEATRRALLRIVVMPGRDQDVADWRNIAFGQLAKYGEPRLLPLVVRAYELGLGSSPLPQRGLSRKRQQYRGLLSFLVHRIDYADKQMISRQQRSGQFSRVFNDSDLRFLRYAAEPMKAALTPVLSSGDTTAWTDVKALLTLQGGWSEKSMMQTVASQASVAFFSVPAFEVLTELVIEKAPAALRDEIVIGLLQVDQPDEASGRLRHALWMRCLTSDDAKLKALAARTRPPLPEAEAIAPLAALLDDPEFSEHRIRIVGSLTRMRQPEVVPVLRKLVNDGSAYVRTNSVKALVALDPDRATDYVLPALRDEDDYARRSAAEICGQLLDPKTVPDLLSCMRDADKSVQKAARKSLTLIREYVESRRLWERLLDGGVLDAPSAAEALIRQTADTEPTAVRVAALRSLGTLGQPETLPFLIGFLKHEDSALREAAMAAIERINRVPAKK